MVAILLLATITCIFMAFEMFMDRTVTILFVVMAIPLKNMYKSYERTLLISVFLTTTLELII